jgi:hypothetical protein
MNDFSRLLCGTASVRSAFEGTGPIAVWWRLVLWLHGKPTTPILTEAERVRCVANGFRFYAGLYAVLGVVLLLAAAMLAYIGWLSSGVPFGYAALSTISGGAFLLVVARFGTGAAEAFRHGQSLGRVHLVAFVVMLTAFLSLLLGAVSLAIHLLGLLAPLPNIAVCAALFTLGIGSYFVELVYLLTSPLPDTV